MGGPAHEVVCQNTTSCAASHVAAEKRHSSCYTAPPSNRMKNVSEHACIPSSLSHTPSECSAKLPVLRLSDEVVRNGEETGNFSGLSASFKRVEQAMACSSVIACSLAHTHRSEQHR